MKKITLSIIGSVGIPANYGGFETLVENIVKFLGKEFDITVYCSSKAYSKKLQTYLGAKLKYINLHANGISSILYDIISIFSALKFSKVLLILGVSGCIILPLLKIINKGKISIVNIDGIEWKRNKWNWIARFYLKIAEFCAVKFADAVIADNKAIQSYVKKTYKRQSIFIPYGGDNAMQTKLSKEIINRYPFLQFKYAFKVARIEPENNIHLILDAFSKYKLLNLVIVGNWNTTNYGIKLRQKYSNFNNIFLLDPIYDKNILNQIRSNAYIYVHGHSAGGTNPSLVEAMHLGLPILAYNVIYNKFTTRNKALYFSNSDELCNILKNLDNQLLKKIGCTMKEISNKKYQWKSIAIKYKNLIKDLNT